MPTICSQKDTCGGGKKAEKISVEAKRKKKLVIGGGGGAQKSVDSGKGTAGKDVTKHVPSRGGGEGQAKKVEKRNPQAHLREFFTGTMGEGISNKKKKLIYQPKKAKKTRKTPSILHGQKKDIQASRNPGNKNVIGQKLNISHNDTKLKRGSFSPWNAVNNVKKEKGGKVLMVG